jgi:hypothetical protein
MNSRFTLTAASLLAMMSACSSTSSGSGSGEDTDAAEKGLNSDDGTDASDVSDAETSFDTGVDPVVYDAGSSSGSGGGSSSGTDAGSQRLACYRPALGVCQSELVAASEAASWNSQCKFQGGTTDPCSTTGLIGCCVGDSNHYCYYTEGYTLATAQQNCSLMGGTWSAGP